MATRRPIVLVSGVISELPVGDSITPSFSELPVSQLQDGAARQLLQTDAAGTGVEWTSNVDIPGTLDVTSAATFDAAVTTTGLLSASGKISVPLASKEGPSIYFGTDTNTGIYSPGADQVAISTNGTGRLFVDSSGRVLVGANSTSGASTFYDDIVVTNTTAGTGAGITLVANATNGFNAVDFGDTDAVGRGRITYSHADDSLRIDVASDEAFRVDSSRRLLLGTSSAFGSSSGDLLQVSHTFGGRLLLQRNKTDITTNEEIGSIIWYSNAGSVQAGGSISCAAESAHANNDKPSRLVFSTNPGSPATAPVERMRITSAGVLQIADASDITVGTTTGTKIGTATSQKIGFYNATPVVQPTTGVAEAAFVENSGGTAVNVDSTFGGYTLQQVVQALQNLGILA